MNAITPALALVVLLAAGCVNTPPAPTEQFYRLQSEGRPLLDALEQPQLLIRRFTAAGLLRERALLFSEDAGQRVLQQHAYHYWADAPATVMQEYWLARLGTTDNPDADAVYEIDARLLRMERLLGEAQPRVMLAIELTLTDRRSRQTISRRHDIVMPAASPSVVDAIRAYEAAADEIIKRTLRDIAIARTPASEPFASRG